MLQILKYGHKGPLIKSGKIRKMFKIIKFSISSAKFLKPIFNYKNEKKIFKNLKKNIFL